MQQHNNKKKLIILDCNGLIHRAYHALPPLTTRGGEMVNAVYGFFTMFFKAVNELKPDFVVAAFDLGGETFRHKQYEQYKAHREKADQELYQQIPIVQDILKSFAVPIAAMRGVEADDIIGAIAEIAKSQMEVIVVTGDLDMLQLVEDGKVEVFAMRKGLTDVVLYNKEKVQERFGFDPQYIPDFKGLKGDPSDNIPGVPGIGDKTASELIKKFNTVEELYEKLELADFSAADIKEGVKKKLLENKEQAFISKNLALIRRNTKVDFNMEDAKFGNFDLDEAKSKFEKLEMGSLIKRMDDVFGRKEISLFGGGREEKGAHISQKEDRKGQSIEDKIEQCYNDGIFSKTIYDLELSIIPVIREMEKNGIKLDTERLEDLSKKLSAQIEKITKQVYDFCGAEFNLSSPQQLAEILFEKLHLPVKDLKKTPGGVVSTAAPELEKLAEESPVIPLILKYRELEKLRNTYVDALPKLVGGDGRVHTKFDQLGAVTGRVSSYDPN
ncbi:MAG: DNA polymerase, partial [bacterium]